MRRCTVFILTGVVFCFLLAQAECSVVLRTLVVNPSKTKTQNALLKGYLPKEATPADVVELGDLKIDYDITKALYYVYKQFELAPGESVSRQLEIKDIWLIAERELDSLIARARKLVEALRETTYAEAAAALEEYVVDKAAEILERQNAALDALPQTHIAVYRENVKILDGIKGALARLEKMSLEIQLSAGGAGKRVTVRATWFLILGVVVALGLISLVFFIIWQRQAGIAAIEQKTKESSHDEE